MPLHQYLKLAPLPQQLTYLRRWWIVLGVIVLLGWLDVLLRYYPHYDSYSDFSRVFGHYVRTARLHVLVYLLLLTISYTEKRVFWWIAIGIIASKLGALLHFYFSDDWHIHSVFYNSELMNVFTHFHLYGLAGIFFGNNPVAVTFLSTVYLYWLIGCIRMIRHLTYTTAGSAEPNQRAASRP